MEPSDRKLEPKERYRGITEKSRCLLFMLRETPYVTLRQIHHLFYKDHKTLSYAREMLRVLTKNKLVEKYLLGNGVFVYFLSSTGRRIVEFFLEDRPKFHLPTSSFYYVKKPTKGAEVNKVFLFPTVDLEFHYFTPHDMNAHPFHHTQALFDIYSRLVKSRRFRHVLWLDQVRHKKEALGLPFHPDLLLTNDLTTDAHRIYVELENSRIKAQSLLDKLNHLTTVPADAYLYICTSETVFFNFGRLIRKIILGEIKVRRQTLYFSHRAHAALVRNVYIALWVPTVPGEESKKSLNKLPLYRYDHPIFDKEMWMMKVDERGIQVLDPESQIPIRVKKVIPYAGRRLGEREKVLGDLLDAYSGQFRSYLETLVPPSQLKIDPSPPNPSTPPTSGLAA
jgi:hypothetical protein